MPYNFNLVKNALTYILQCICVQKYVLTSDFYTQNDLKNRPFSIDTNVGVRKTNGARQQCLSFAIRI